MFRTPQQQQQFFISFFILKFFLDYLIFINGIKILKIKQFVFETFIFFKFLFFLNKKNIMKDVFKK